MGQERAALIPYIVVSLIVSLGRLNYQEARSIFLKGGAVLLLFWAIILAIIVFFPLGFPAWKSASFFSTSLLESPPDINLIELFIPSNPFEALAETIIPAVVLFCLAVGFALIGFENKQGLLDILSTLSDALMRITGLVAKLTPIGVFAILASAVGTLPLEAFDRLGVYVTLQAFLALLLSFWLLPALVAMLTPLSYGDIIRSYRTALITAFATANLLIVLPLIVERSQELLGRIDPAVNKDSPEITAPLNVLVPLSFVFPSMGKLLSLAFVPFAAWYNGSSLPLFQYPAFLLTGLASFFGDPTIATRFLLTLFNIPQDMLQLYVTVDQISAGRFGTLLAGTNTIALGLLATCVINGWMAVRRRRLLRFGAVAALALALLLGSVHVLFTYAVPHTYAKGKVLEELQLLRVRDPGRVKVFREPPPALPPDPSAPSRLIEIRERGVLRACYLPDDYPSSYFNAGRDLVGFDVEMAHLLAKDLGVGLEFVPVSSKSGSPSRAVFNQLPKLLDSGYCDITASLVTVTPERTEVVGFSDTVMDFTVGFIVRDRSQDQFNYWRDIQSLGPLRIGFLSDNPYYQTKLQGLLPQAEFFPIQSTRAYLESENQDVDAIALAAEHGAAWTLLYPDYAITIPKPAVSIPVAYALPDGDRPFIDWVDAWLELKQKDGTVKSLFDYWVQGKTRAVEPPRWSVVRDVLGWVD